MRQRLPLGPHLVVAVTLFATMIAAGAAAPARAADTLIWVGVRSGLLFYNQTDPNDLEDLATALSVDRQAPLGDRINFDPKGWEIPINLKLGFSVTPSVNLWGFYQRMPYTLEGPLPPRDGALHVDTVRLDLPANVFGVGADFRLGSEGYGSSLLLGFGLGTFTTKGDDSDVLGYRNFRVDASGTFWEVSLAAEFDFSAELGFYPFISFHGTSTDEANAYLQARGIAGVSDRVDEIPSFDIDYMAVQVGLSVRFRVYPFEIEGDPERGDY